MGQTHRFCLSSARALHVPLTACPRGARRDMPGQVTRTDCDADARRCSVMECEVVEAEIAELRREAERGVECLHRLVRPFAHQLKATQLLPRNGECGDAVRRRLGNRAWRERKKEREREREEREREREQSKYNKVY